MGVGGEDEEDDEDEDEEDEVVVDVVEVEVEDLEVVEVLLGGFRGIWATRVATWSPKMDFGWSQQSKLPIPNSPVSQQLEKG